MDFDLSRTSKYPEHIKTDEYREKKEYIAELTSAALYGITSRAKNLIKEKSENSGIVDTVKTKAKLYQLYDKYTKDCNKLINSNKTLNEIKEESKFVIELYISNISEMI